MVTFFFLFSQNFSLYLANCCLLSFCYMPPHRVLCLLQTSYRAEDGNKMPLCLFLNKAEQTQLSRCLSLLHNVFQPPINLVAIHQTGPCKAILASFLLPFRDQNWAQCYKHNLTSAKTVNDHYTWPDGDPLANMPYLALLSISATSSYTHQGTRLYGPRKDPMSADELNPIYNAHWRCLFSVCPLQTFSHQRSHGHNDKCIQAADEQFKLLTEVATKISFNMMMLISH